MYADWMEHGSYLMNLFTLNYVITSAIALTARGLSNSAKFCRNVEIPRYGNSTVMGKFHSLAQNSVTHGILWALDMSYV